VRPEQQQPLLARPPSLRLHSPVQLAGASPASPSYEYEPAEEPLDYDGSFPCRTYAQLVVVRGGGAQQQAPSSSAAARVGGGSTVGEVPDADDGNGATSRARARGESKWCVVCEEEAKSVGLLHGSSMHLCLCRGCAAHYRQQGEHACPMCRQRVEAVVDVFGAAG
jgi:hypothetical protein